MISSWSKKVDFAVSTTMSATITRPSGRHTLIISDSAANVERIANIIARVDLASNEEVEIVPLLHA